MFDNAESYARLPTFSAVIDGLAACLGIVGNKEDALTSFRTFDRRIAVYNSRSQSQGREDKILSALAGSDEVLKSLLWTRLGEIEGVFTDARADPMVTWETEKDGRRQFFEICVAPWIASLLVDARSHPGSVLDCARLLLEANAATGGNAPGKYLATCRAEIRRALPEGVRVADFRAKLNRLDRRSQRKHCSIEQDIAELQDELRRDISSPAELAELISAIQNLYVAGMATLRLCALVSDIISESEFLTLITDNLINERPINNKKFPYKLDQEYLINYKFNLDPSQIWSDMFDGIVSIDPRIKTTNYDAMRVDLAASTPKSILSPAIDYSEGMSHLYYGRNLQAEQCLRRVVESAGSRQLGEIAANAASILIALELTKPGPFKFGQFNPLLRTRIENMRQWDEFKMLFEPTPFSEWSSPPAISFYDSHLLMCVGQFNSVPRAEGNHIICNPLERFDKNLKSIVVNYDNPNATMKAAERNRPAIAGTSVTPYQLLRNLMHYYSALFWQSPALPEMAGMEAYLRLPIEEQRLVLRFIDPDMFKLDLEAHGPR